MSDGSTILKAHHISPTCGALQWVGKQIFHPWGSSDTTDQREGRYSITEELSHEST